MVRAPSGRVLALLGFDKIERPMGDDATPLVNRARQRYGQPMTGLRATHFTEGKWLGLPFHGRVDGIWLRKDTFAQVGRSIEAGDFDTYDKLRESALVTVANAPADAPAEQVRAR